ncbi:hypothetical protein ATANTOWER_024805 [Ataeniobius toweri]|uniref:Uncharacterized protein n=1 Tax=Ataeniobius toweri TaxID=208326 RepID=A0ABU7C6Y2_9TELE|nr:hypothetical protein [Ataeniobius toweri]
MSDIKKQVVKQNRYSFRTAEQGQVLLLSQSAGKETPHHRATVILQVLDSHRKVTKKSIKCFLLEASETSVSVLINNTITDEALWCRSNHNRDAFAVPGK